MKKRFSAYLMESGRLSLSALKSLPAAEFSAREPLGRLALMHGLLKPDDIDRVLAEQQKSGGDLFGQLALRLGLLTEPELDLLLAGQAVRSCLELVEDLVLSGLMDLATGLAAISAFVCRDDFRNDLKVAQSGLI